MKNVKFKIIKGGKVVAVGAMVAGGFMANAAMAQAADYSGVLSGLDATTAITAIIAAGAIMAGPGFAKWATKKVAKFFG